MVSKEVSSEPSEEHNKTTSDNELTESVKDVGNVNPGQFSIIGSLPINFSLTTLDLSLQPKLPETATEKDEELNNIVKEEEKVTTKDQPPTAKDTTKTQNDEIKSIFVSTKLGPNTSWSPYTPTANLKDITEDITKIMTPNAIIFTSKEEMIQNPTTVDENKGGKKEYIRPGAALPDIIKMSNYVASDRMSSKAFSTRCRNLLKQCKQPQECKAHTSFSSLKKLSTTLLEIYEDPKKFSKDWETDKTILLGR